MIVEPPQAFAPHTFDGVPVRAIEDVMAARLRQIVEFGHTPEHDRERRLDGPLGLIADAQHMLADARDYAAFGLPRRDITRRKLVNAAALALACIDWIDAEPSEPSEPGAAA